MENRIKSAIAAYHFEQYDKFTLEDLKAVEALAGEGKKYEPIIMALEAGYMMGTSDAVKKMTIAKQIETKDSKALLEDDSTKRFLKIFANAVDFTRKKHGLEISGAVYVIANALAYMGEKYDAYNNLYCYGFRRGYKQALKERKAK